MPSFRQGCLRPRGASWSGRISSRGRQAYVELRPILWSANAGQTFRRRVYSNKISRMWTIQDLSVKDGCEELLA